MRRVNGTPHIDGGRLVRVLRELAQFGEEPDGGVSREGYGQADARARQHLAQVSREAGLTTSVDEAGNLIVQRPWRLPGAPKLLMGSHLDSVRGGGWLDGAYGVAAAIEVVAALTRRGGLTQYEPTAVAFANEAGARFPYPNFGSRALVGQLDLPEKTVDAAGRSLRGPLRRAGGDLDQVHQAAWPPGSIAAFLELHVEEGPILERAGVPIGVVTAIAGRALYDVRVKGRQAHAGTTPMDLRRDALAVAARVVLAVERLARDRKLCRVATVGAFDPEPNLDDVIAGEVGLTAEIRDTDLDRMALAERELTSELDELARTTGATIEVGRRTRTAPAETHPALRGAIAAAASQLGHRHIELPSGSSHDAQVLASVAPVGMIFVPSRDGVSRSATEDSDPVDLMAGADTLLHTALRFQGDGGGEVTEEGHRDLVGVP